MLEELGWDERSDALFASLADLGPDVVPGRVARIDRGAALVVTASGTAHAQSSVEEPLATGDWVAVDPGDGVVVALLPRRSAISRRGSSIDVVEQVLAANVDLVLLVHGLDRQLRLGRIERSLVMAWESGATPVVVLTKADVAEHVDATVGAVEAVAPGVDVVAVSATTGDGVDDVAARLQPNRTAVLLGESGGGKSTLVNRLVGTDVQATAEVRAGDHKGRHTTTARELIILPGGGIVIDTPGLRSVGVWEAEEGMARTYADIEDLGEQCRFRDCRHAGEPGCAVAAAVADGSLAADRLERYADLGRELDWVAGQHDERLRRDRRRKDKVAGRALRDHPKYDR